MKSVSEISRLEIFHEIKFQAPLQDFMESSPQSPRASPHSPRADRASARQAQQDCSTSKTTTPDRQRPTTDRRRSSEESAGEESAGEESAGEDGNPLAAEAELYLRLRINGPAKHDLLGPGIVLAISETEEVAEGVLSPGAKFASLELANNKVLFQFTRRVRVAGRGPARYQQVVTTRHVFQDALTPIDPERRDALSPRGLPEEPAVGSRPCVNAFESMLNASSSSTAFTHGLDGPELAAHERRRKQARLKDAPVRGRNKVQRKTKEPKLNPEERILAFPNQSLCKVDGKLHCLACKTDRSLRLSSLRTHLDSDEHKRKLAAHNDALAGDADIGRLIGSFFEKHPDVEGQTLSQEVHMYRWNVMESFMYAGVARHKIDMLRHLLERAGIPLTASDHMCKLYIPQIEEREIKRVVKELLGEHFAFIFDGTTRLGEAINMITRSITDNFEIRMRLVAFKTTAVHMDGPSLCRLILKTMQQQCNFDLDYCIAYSRDSCATNGVAVDGLLLHTINAVNMLCFPHTLHNTGKHLQLPVLDQFMTPWLQLVANPGAAKLRWKAIIDGPVPSFSKVRWWSRWEIMKQVAENFGSVPGFLASLEADEIGDASTKKMLTIMNHHRDTLRLELAAVLSCERLCTATYRLEGDGLELLLVHQTVEALRAFGRTLGNDSSDLPSVAALLRQRHTIARGTELYEWFEAPHSKWFTGNVSRMPTAAQPTYKITYSDGGTIEYEEREVRNWIDVRKFPEWTTAVGAVSGAYRYLESRITNNCQSPYHCAESYEVCRVSQLFDPSFAVANLTPGFVDELRAAIPALNGSVAALKAEVEAYRVAARSAPAIDHSDVKKFTEAVLKFWREQGSKMKAWRKAARIVFAIPPTSAASERVFSLLEDMFGHGMDASLADLIQAALMLRYNQRRVG